jgi:hypothetical protein
MANSPTYESIRTVESPQPAIIIGIGEFGQAVRDRIMLQRDVYDGFKSPLMGEDAGSVSTRILPTEKALWSSDADTIRANQLSDGALRDVSRDLRELFNKVRLHRDAPLFDTLRPVIVVVGATWSEVGQALLWPIAGIIRAAIGSSMQYTLYGVFVSADYHTDAEKREYGDALSWQVLDEGDRLAAGEVIWQGKIRSGIPSDIVDPRLYDNVFLIDGHKDNNGSIGHDDNVFEVATHVASLLESMVYSALPRVIDQALLDDHSLRARQLYIGVGSSSLVVPLRDIKDLVRRFTMGRLIQDRLLTMPENQPAIDSDTVDRIERLLATHIGESIQKNVTDVCTTIYQQQLVHATAIEYAVNVLPNQATIQPVVESVKIKSLFHDAADEQVDADVILARQREEQLQGIAVLEQTKSALSKRQFQLIETVEDVAGRNFATLLGNGGTGLIRGVATLRALATRLEEQALLSEKNAITGAKIAKKHQDVLLREQKWLGLNAEEMLRQAVKLRAHIPALFIRAFVLVGVLFQLYWDALRKGLTTLFPIQFFNINAGADALRQWLPLLIDTMLIVFIPVIIIGALPYIGVWWQQYWRRTQLERYMRQELDAIAAEDAAFMADVLSKRLGDQRLSDLTIAKDELQTHADRAMQSVKREEIERQKELRQRIDYLESAVVDPAQVMAPYQNQAAEQIVRQYGANIVPTWRPRQGAVNDVWRMESIDTVVMRLESQINPVVSDITTKTIDYYLQDRDMINLMHRLWRSSVPWLKASYDVEASELYSRLRLDVLMVSRNVRDIFASVIDGPDGKVIPVDWPDMHRVMMLRMNCGVVSTELTRWRQLMHAGEAHMRVRNRKHLAPLPQNPNVAVSNYLDEVIDIQDIRTNVVSLLALYDELVNNPELTGSQRIWFVMAIQPLITFLKNESQWTLPNMKLPNGLRAQLPQKLRHLDIFLDSQANDTTRMLLTELLVAIDALLRTVHIEPFSPDNGVTVTSDAKMVVAYAHDPFLPVDVIIRCRARGYRNQVDDQVLLPPYVMVNRAE